MTEVEQEKEASQNGCLEDANVSDKVRQGTNETVDWHLVNTSYIMRHLQLSTTCC